MKKDVPSQILNKIMNEGYEDIIYNIEGALSETRVSTDDNKFNKLLNDDRYNIICIGHTHGNF